MANATIIPLANGPYLANGPITLQDPNGNEFVVPGEKIALCRCGHSSTKPFCNGTHKKIHFRAETKAA